MSKPIRYAVAVVVRREADGQFLVVRRPPDDDELPNIWGLPAVTLSPGEPPESGVRRVGREKLGVELEPLHPVGVMSADRGAFELILMDMEARIASGDPDVGRGNSPNTRYVAQQWTAVIDPLREGAEKGSLCCQILIDAIERRRGSNDSDQAKHI